MIGLDASNIFPHSNHCFDDTNRMNLHLVTKTPIVPFRCTASFKQRGSIGTICWILIHGLNELIHSEKKLKWNMDMDMDMLLPTDTLNIQIDSTTLTQPSPYH